MFGFLFVTVSSRLTGEIGSSSNPISGMTVATLLLTCLIFVLRGLDGAERPVDGTLGRRRSSASRPPMAGRPPRTSRPATSSAPRRSGNNGRSSSGPSTSAVFLGCHSDPAQPGLHDLYDQEPADAQEADPRQGPDGNRARRPTTPRTTASGRPAKATTRKCRPASIWWTTRARFITSSILASTASARTRDDGTDVPRSRLPRQR